MFRRSDGAERWHPDRHRHADQPARPIAILREMADDLIEGRIGESVELDLGDRPESPQSHPDGSANDGGFGQWGVEAAFGSEALLEAVSHPEHTTLVSDVLTEDHDAIIGRH